MAANNYYNFTHGGTQYGAQFTAPGQQTGAAYPPPAPYGQGQVGTGQVGAYGGGGGVSSTDPYVIAGYTRTPQGQQQQQQQQQSYYNQAAAATGYPTMGSSVANKIAARPTAPSTVYPTYSANTSGATSSGSYAGFAPPQQQQQANPGSKSFTNYDAAVYNAVSAYAQGGPSGSGRSNNGMGGYKKGPPKGMGMSGKIQRPKPQTLHYCDVCKISCAGPQTYKEHLEGQKHKKKEAAQKAGTPPVPKGGPVGLRCELCDVTCTGSDAYAAHIRGAKHQKVVKLHTKLGKPIPSDNPTVIAPSPSNNHNNTQNNNNHHGSNTSNSSYNHPATATTTKSAASAAMAGNGNASSVGGGGGGTGNNLFAKPAAPKISFVGGGVGGNIKVELITVPLALATSSSVVVPAPATETTKENENVVSSPALVSPPLSTTYTSPAAPGGGTTIPSPDNLMDYIEKDVQPVGQDYIEEIRNEEGKVVTFNCKLCECRFNDPNAKDMHMKGRRHRLQYKKKVNPNLIVDVKPSSRQKKIEERRTARTIRKPMANDMFQPRGPVPLMQPTPRGFGPPGPGGYGGGPSPYFIPPLLRRPETPEDRHVMTKHAEIYPEESELQAIQKIVSNTEKALKFVSDAFAEEDCKAATTIENGGEVPPPTDADLQAARKLKGVMRVGNLAKGLLLRGDREVELVVLCSEKPTLSMLNRIFDCLPKQMEIVAIEEKYEIQKVVENAGIKISSTVDPQIEVNVILTSPVLRNNSVEAPGEAQATQVPEPDLLDKEKCLDALAALRHAKWFQARATTLQSCVIVIRILRDMVQRVPQFQAMPSWAIELLTEKAINSPGVPISPGDALRIVFEILASGLLLQFGPGLLDPCEKESCDALTGLSEQAREDITAFSQQALRQIAFRQIHQVLGMEAMPRSSKFGTQQALGNRKRRRDPSGNTERDETDASNDLKKDKKEEAVTTGEDVVIKSEIISA